MIWNCPSVYDSQELRGGKKKSNASQLLVLSRVRSNDGSAHTLIEQRRTGSMLKFVGPRMSKRWMMKIYLHYDEIDIELDRLREFAGLYISVFFGII